MLLVTLSANGYLGRYESPGEIINSTIPSKILEDRAISQIITKDKLLEQDTKMILFGDFHVHSTYSADAFMLSLPMLGGEGTHPPADACNFARFCSSLDFWSINDHAESLTTKDWQETIDSVRQCNEVSTQLGVPDTVAFLGWEWTQEGGLGRAHYGHKNIIYEREADIIEILKTVDWDVRILGNEYKDKPFTGREESLDKCYFNSRPHDFSTSELRERVASKHFNYNKKS